MAFAPNQTAFMETVSGRVLDILHPVLSQIVITDIAHSLAHQCRYGGHSKFFYSIAEHSVKVARAIEMMQFGSLKNIPIETHREIYALVLLGLLHDASEAYLVDIPTPIKAQLSNYKEMEEGLMNVILKRFGLSEFEFATLPEIIHKADRYMLFQEANTLVPSKGINWKSYKIVNPTSFPGMFKSRGWSPRRGTRVFLREFRRLTGTMTMTDKMLNAVNLFWI